MKWQNRKGEKYTKETKEQRKLSISFLQFTRKVSFRMEKVFENKVYRFLQRNDGDRCSPVSGTSAQPFVRHTPVSRLRINEKQDYYHVQSAQSYMFY